VVLYFGQATESWLRAKLCELKKVSGYGRQRPLATPAIYMGPPATPAKERFRTREAVVLQAPQPPSIAPLLPLLAQLGLESPS
jgi:hypothetical protein